MMAAGELAAIGSCRKEGRFVGLRGFRLLLLITLLFRLKGAQCPVFAYGFGAGPNQDLKNPLGVGGIELHQWMFPTSTFQKMRGKDGGTTGIDGDFARRGFDGLGAWILGRNMFGPIRGAWPDDQWKEMAGGTTFHFVTDGIQRAFRPHRINAPANQPGILRRLVRARRPSHAGGSNASRCCTRTRFA